MGSRHRLNRKVRLLSTLVMKVGLHKEWLTAATEQVTNRTVQEQVTQVPHRSTASSSLLLNGHWQCWSALAQPLS